jgi:hypothetical protein
MINLELLIGSLSKNNKISEKEKTRVLTLLSKEDVYDLKTKFYQETINLPKNFHYNKISFIPNGFFNGQEIKTEEIDPFDLTYTKNNEKKFSSMTEFLNELSNEESTDSRIKFIKDTKFCFNLYFGIELNKQVNNSDVYRCIIETKTKINYIRYDFNGYHSKTALLNSFGFITKYHNKTFSKDIFQIFQQELSNLINKLNLYNIVPDFKSHSFYNLIYIIILTNTYDTNDEEKLKKGLLETLNSEKIIKILNLFSNKNKIITLEDIHHRKKKDILNNYMDLLIRESDKIKITVPCYCSHYKIYFQQEDFGIGKKLTLYI